MLGRATKGRRSRDEDPRGVHDSYRDSAGESGSGFKGASWGGDGQEDGRI
jgi:hypothetical protein